MKYEIKKPKAILPKLTAFKNGGSLDKTVSYQDGIENNTKIPKYANAKCGKKLVKKTTKKQTGGNIEDYHKKRITSLMQEQGVVPSIAQEVPGQKIQVANSQKEQDLRNQDYLNNPFNLERIWKNIKTLGSSMKLPAISAVATTAAIPGLAMMGTGLAGNIIGGAVAGSMGTLAPTIGNAMLSANDTKRFYQTKMADYWKENHPTKLVSPEAIDSWLNSIKKK